MEARAFNGAPARAAQARYACQVVTIELFGVPRLRAGREAVAVEAGSLGAALAALAAACPALGEDLLGPDGGLGEGYLVAIGGERFTRDVAAPLEDGEVLVLLSAQAGG
jgi:sulfur-carrier protein